MTLSQLVKYLYYITSALINAQSSFDMQKKHSLLTFDHVIMTLTFGFDLWGTNLVFVHDTPNFKANISELSDIV